MEAVAGVALNRYPENGYTELRESYGRFIGFDPGESSAPTVRMRLSA